MRDFRRDEDEEAGEKSVQNVGGGEVVRDLGEWVLEK